MQSLKVGLLGIGTVGGGTYQVLKRNQAAIANRAGRPIEIVKVAERDLARAKQITAGAVALTDQIDEVVSDPTIDVVVELIGGYTLAKDAVLKAIAHGKHVVTANKALLALHGNEIFSAAAEKGVIVAYEAAVAGGIPIIKALREGLVANQVEWLAGIINGTTNFILTEMRDKGLAFDDVLAEAQRLGYAEADPTFDVEGIDAAHKLMLMAAIAFAMPVQFDRVYTEGISKLDSKDIRYAEELGYRVKLLGISKRSNAGIEIRVHPTLIPEKRLIANVDGAMNAVLVKGDAVGPTMYYGAGAGAEPTASAVIADLVDVARMQTVAVSQRVPYLAHHHMQALGDCHILPIDQIHSAYYLRLRALDKPGVMADITKILAQREISIDAMMQKEPQDNEHAADIVILTHITQEANINQAISAIEALSALDGAVVKLRMEALSR